MTLLFYSKIVVFLRSYLNCMFIFLMPEIELAFYKRSSRCDFRLSLENAPLILESSSSSLPSSFTGTCSNSNWSSSNSSVNKGCDDFFLNSSLLWDLLIPLTLLELGRVMGGACYWSGDIGALILSEMREWSPSSEAVNSWSSNILFLFYSDILCTSVSYRTTRFLFRWLYIEFRY